MLIRSGMGMQLSGSVGGVVASHNAGGAYLRNRSVPTNPNSARQQLVRSAFSLAAATWQGYAQTIRDGWAAYASETPVVNRLGDTITLSGWNMFARTFAFMLSCDQISSLPAAAPATPGLASLGSPLVITLKEGAGVGVADYAEGVNGPYLISLSPPLSPGVTFFAGPYTAYLTGPDYSADWGSALAEILGNQSVNRYGVPLEGEIRCVRVQATDGEGKLCTPFETKVVVAAAA